MANDHSEDSIEQDHKKEGTTKPASETLHTTDPQEHMKGPISSLMQKAEESFKEDDTDQPKKSD